MIYLRNKDLLEEIRLSKDTYTSYKNEEDKVFDIILEDISRINIRTAAQAKRNRANRIAKQLHLEAVAANTNPKKKPKLAEFAIKWQSIPKEDLVFRINTYEHIPEAPGRVKTPKQERDLYEKLPFPPYKQYRYNASGEIECVGISHWKGGIANGEFCCDHGRMTDTLGRMFIQLCDRYGTRSNWRSYTYNDEMRGQAINQLVQVGLLFDEFKSQNPFAYYTRIVQNSFTKILNSEKAQQRLRDDILEMNGLVPSNTRQNENSNSKFVNSYDTAVNSDGTVKQLSMAARVKTKK
jgi:hypothetical protein